MKKGIIILIVLAIITLAPLTLIVRQYIAEKNEIDNFNLEYEKYENQNVYGTNLGSLINYAINNNEKYKISKDESGKYIDDDKYCMKIEIKMLSTENEYKTVTYDMETINSLGIERFVRNFNLLEFKCTEISYNSYGRVSKLVFELNQ